MKKKFLTSITGVAAIAIGLSSYNHATSNSSGAPDNRTGSPSDATNASFGSGVCSDCHAGGGASAQVGWITSDVPAGGYVPGDTYTITASASDAGRSMFGFSCTVEEDATSNKVGTLVAGTGTKISGTNWITHDGAATSADNASWSFTWTAPAAGTGDLTFYAAFIGADGANGNSGDNTFTSTLAVTEGAVSSIAKNADEIKISMFPNPANNQFTIQGLSGAALQNVNVMNVNGELVKNFTNLSMRTFDVSDLQAGMYIVNAQLDDQVITQKLLKY